jgi:hypothetical protein
MVSVPETAMNEDNSLIPGENNVGFAGKLSAVQAEAESFGKQLLAEQEFGLCILPPDAGHHP